MTLLIPLTVCAFAVSADPIPEKPIDTSFLRLYAETKGFMLGRPAKPKFSPDGQTVFFLRSEAKNPKQKLFAFDVKTKQTKELLTPEMLLGGKDEQLSDEEKARRERQRITAGGFADYHLSPDGSKILVSLSGRLFVFDRTTGKHAELKTGSGACIDPKWSPDGKMIGYARGFDVYAFDLTSEKETAVTTGGTSVKTNGLAEFVAQEEMGRHSGFWWSPDSKQIAFCEADHTGVEQWAVADPLNPDKLGAPQYYPRPGKKNVSVRLGIATLGSEKVVWVEWDRTKYEYVAAVNWDESGPLTVQLQDRKQREIALLRIDAKTGTMTKLLVDSDPAFMNIRPDALAWLERNHTLGWVCDGANKLIIETDIASTQIINENNIIDYQQSNFSDINTFQAYTEYSDGTIRGTVNFIGYAGGVNPLLLGEGVSSLVVNSTHKKESYLKNIIHIWTTTSAMPKSDVYPLDTWNQFCRMSLPNKSTEPPFRPNVSINEESGFITAIVKPKNFDPAKKYPVIVDVYGGPKHLHVVQAMKNWLIPQWLADQGFIVVAIDNRGTPGRGRDWERAIYQKFGTVPLEDQVKGLQALGAKHPQMDLSRVGIVGWSFGGYMAANAVLRRPDVFRAAVAGAPVTDWEDYDTHYTERYLGVLPESRKAYDEASLIPLAKDLKRPLLLIHGTADDNVYYRHTLKLSDAIFRAGKTCEVLPLPGVTHMYTADPQVAERMWERTVRFFKRELGEVR